MCLDAGKKLAQHAIHRLSQFVNHILVFSDSRPQDVVRKPIAVNEDSDANRSVACVLGRPILGHKRDVIWLNALAVAGLVVADEEGDILYSRSALVCSDVVIPTTKN